MSDTITNLLYHPHLFAGISIITSLIVFYYNYASSHYSVLTCFNHKTFVGGLATVALIVTGLLVSDHMADLSIVNPLKNNTLFATIGTVSFVVGWLLLTLWVIPTDFKKISEDHQYETNKDWSKIYTVVAGLFVMIMTMVAQRFLSDGSWMFYWTIIGLAVAWLIFALLISRESGSYRQDKLVLSIPGAIFIVVSVLVLFVNRKLSLSSKGAAVKEGNVFNPGLVFFTFGWVLIILAISKVDENTEVCT